MANSPPGWTETYNVTLLRLIQSAEGIPEKEANN